MSDRMRLGMATLAAAVVCVAAYVGIAWLASGIEIPPDVPTARLPWASLFRVWATLGFAIATTTGLPHLAGDFLAAILLGAVLGAIFALTRRFVAGLLDV